MTPEYIVIHHSATKDSGTVSWGAIRKWHMGLHPYSPYKNNPWIDIGYHFGIEFVDDQYEILLGRYPDRDGAHTIGMNDKSIGICVVGNFDVDVPDEKMVRKLHSLVTWLQLNYDIPDVNIMGHREYAMKTCPGTNLWKIVEEMKRWGHIKDKTVI